MKRAKFALTAIAVFAVVGGALAFKANRQANTLYSFSAGNCTQQVNLTLTLVPGNLGTISTTLYDVSSHAGACPARTWYITE